MDWISVILAVIGLVITFFLGRSGFPAKKIQKPVNYGPAPRHFRDQAEFMGWYFNCFPLGYWDAAGPVLDTGVPGKPDCDDRVELVRETAYLDGFITHYALVRDDGLYFGVKVADVDKGKTHACILAICGNSFVVCDQNAGRFTKVTGID